MEIFNMIRGHFALLNTPLRTPSQGKEFTVDSDKTKASTWQIVLKLSTGKPARVYVSDILRVYTHIVSSGKQTQTQIDNFVQSHCLTNGGASYIIPLIETFSDIRVSKEGKNVTIQFIPLPETLKSPAE